MIYYFRSVFMHLHNHLRSIYPTSTRLGEGRINTVLTKSPSNRGKETRSK